MNSIAEIHQDHLIVEKPKDAQRLYQKSQFGSTLSGNKLQLNLLEGVFLLAEDKLKVLDTHGKTVNFAKLVLYATTHIPYFEILYLVYRDLRKRGHCIQLVQKKKQYYLRISSSKKKEDSQKPGTTIYVFSEREPFTISKTQQHLQHTGSSDLEIIWYAIVDEEGDLTYYKVEPITFKGTNKTFTYQPTTGYFFQDRIIIFDTDAASMLHSSEFYGKPFGDGLQLSLVEAAYLQQHNVLYIHQLEKQAQKMTQKQFLTQALHIQPDLQKRLLVFSELKNQKLLVKTGFKFGTHFRVYTSNPNTHAEYLVHVVDDLFTSAWAEMSRAIRLAHSVNKGIIFAHLSKDNTISYISFGRLRP